MFTGVGKLKISLPECGFEWKRKSTIRCVGVSLGETYSMFVFLYAVYMHTFLKHSTLHCHMFHIQYAVTKHTMWIQYIREKKGDISHCVPGWFCVLFADNWPLMVHLLLSWRALAAAVTWKHFILTAHYPLWQINRIGKMLCWSHIENLTAKATAGEDAEFVMD